MRSNLFGEDTFVDFHKQEFQKYFHRTKVPVLFIKTKVTGNYEVEQNFELSPMEFCKIYGLPPPIAFPTSDIGREDSPVYAVLATMAVYP